MILYTRYMHKIHKAASIGELEHISDNIKLLVTSDRSLGLTVVQTSKLLRLVKIRSKLINKTITDYVIIKTWMEEESTEQGLAEINFMELQSSNNGDLI